MSTSSFRILVQEDGILCSEGLARYFLSNSSFRIIVQEDGILCSEGLARYFLSSSSFRILVQEDVTISSQGLASHFHEFQQIHNSSPGRWDYLFWGVGQVLSELQQLQNSSAEVCNMCSQGLARHTFMSSISFRILVGGCDFQLTRISQVFFMFSFWNAKIFNSEGPLLFYQIRNDGVVNCVSIVQSASAKNCTAGVCTVMIRYINFSRIRLRSFFFSGEFGEILAFPFLVLHESWHSLDPISWYKICLKCFLLPF